MLKTVVVLLLACCSLAVDTHSSMQRSAKEPERRSGEVAADPQFCPSWESYSYDCNPHHCNCEQCGTGSCKGPPPQHPLMVYLPTSVSDAAHLWWDGCDGFDCGITIAANQDPLHDGGLCRGLLVSCVALSMLLQLVSRYVRCKHC